MACNGGVQGRSTMREAESGGAPQRDEEDGFASDPGVNQTSRSRNGKEVTKSSSRKGSSGGTWRSLTFAFVYSTFSSLLPCAGLAFLRPCVFLKHCRIFDVST